MFNISYHFLQILCTRGVPTGRRSAMTCQCRGGGLARWFSHITILSRRTQPVFWSHGRIWRIELLIKDIVFFVYKMVRIPFFWNDTYWLHGFRPRVWTRHHPVISTKHELRRAFNADNRSIIIDSRSSMDALHIIIILSFLFIPNFNSYLLIAAQIHYLVKIWFLIFYY